MPFMYNKSMEFEYDRNKSVLNKTKHGICFEQAQEIWQSPFIETAARNTTEVRYMAIGKIDDLIYSCIYTIKSGNIRIISARRSRKYEEKIYYESIGI